MPHGVVSGSLFFEGGGMSIVCDDGYDINEESLGVRVCDEGVVAQEARAAPGDQHHVLSARSLIRVMYAVGTDPPADDGVPNSGVLTNSCGQCGGLPIPAASVERLSTA